MTNFELRVTDDEKEVSKTQNAPQQPSRSSLSSSPFMLRLRDAFQSSTRARLVLLRHALEAYLNGVTAANCNARCNVPRA